MTLWSIERVENEQKRGMGRKEDGLRENNCLNEKEQGEPVKLQSTKVLKVDHCKYLESNIKATAFLQDRFENRGVESIKNSFRGNLGQKDSCTKERNGIQHGSKI